MTLPDVWQRLGNLRRYKGTGDRAGLDAPHKPLMLLAALAEAKAAGRAENHFAFQTLKTRFDDLWPRVG